MTKTIVPGIVLCILLMSTQALGNVLVDSVRIVEHGIYQAEHTGEVLQVGTTATGLIRPARDAVLKQATEQVPAQLGTSFGCFFVIEGEPPESAARVTLQVHHPPMTRPNNNTETGTVDSVPCTFPIGKTVGYVYTFDYAWEMAVGDWSIQVWWDGEKLAEQRFTVFEPKN